MTQLTKQALGDHDALDLVRPRVDLGDLGIAHEALDGEVVSRSPWSSTGQASTSLWAAEPSRGPGRCTRHDESGRTIHEGAGGGGAALSSRTHLACALTFGVPNSEAGGGPGHRLGNVWVDPPVHATYTVRV